jgi:hypothetical protein
MGAVSMSRVRMRALLLALFNSSARLIVGTCTIRGDAGEPTHH